MKREVTGVVTPGLLVEDDSLSAAEPNYLASWEGEGEGGWLALIDISTGEVLTGFYEKPELAAQEMVKHKVKEWVVSPKSLAEDLKTLLSQMLPELLVSETGRGGEDDLEKKNYSEGFLLSLKQIPSPHARRSLCRLLGYVEQTQRSVLHHLAPIQVLKERQFMGMDGRTFRHLELIQNTRGEGRGGTLFWVLNQCQTAMGARRLKKWIHYPLLDIPSIRRRQDAVAELLESPDHLFSLQEALKNIQDIERMLGKLALATVNARDLHSLAQSLLLAEALVRDFKDKLTSPLLQDRTHAYPLGLNSLATRLRSQIREDCPATVREGGMIADGVHPELDELKGVSRDGKSIIARMEEQERKRTSIGSLKIRYNKVFGYYIEVTNLHKDSIPADYIRKQTLANAERFITPELKEYENKVLGAEERIRALEYQLFCGLREAAAAQLAEIRQAAETIGTLDTVASLARVARDNRYVRPSLVPEQVLLLKDGRHPVLEKILAGERFIPNDIEMDEKGGRLFLITGPNMAGKSTVMRQVALIILLAQMGSFVPASEATVGIVDQLFTRIGASDDLSQGQSTFMVEMLETAHILKSATEFSFIVLDEIGRGTSTYDGMSIAWAVAEFVVEQLRCRALFATHYHELTELSSCVGGVENYQVAVKEWNDQILFLRKLIRGGASRSYGIEVARLAGLPEGLLARAREVLKNLELSEGAALTQLNASKTPSPQLDLFQAKNHPVVEALRGTEVDTLTPIQALNFLNELKKIL